MKRIGILFGQERSFPLALVDRINAAGRRTSSRSRSRSGGVSPRDARSATT